MISAIVLVVELVAFSVCSQQTDSFRADRVLVCPKPGQDRALAELHAMERISVHRTFPGMGDVQVLQLPEGANPRAIVAKYQRSRLAQFVELDYFVQAAAVPNDPSFTLQWGLSNSGQGPGSLADADIDAPEAWEVRTSATNVVIAILDSGVRINHEDLNANLWRNPGEIPGNGIDDDNNGYVDDIHGADILNHTGNPFDESGHGSIVAGVIGAVGNNGIGVAGVAWKARMMICKFLNASGGGSISDTVECFDYARANGAKILNASFVTTEVSMALSNAITACQEAGIILVAASGNSRKDIDATPFFPASYPHSNIVVVMATDSADGLYPLNNFGATNVDLAAPGVNIRSTWVVVNDSYVDYTGTSMAAAFVAGAMALVWEQYPEEPYWQIIQRVMAAADPLPVLAGKCVTGGRLNLKDALSPRPSLSGVRTTSPGTIAILLRKGAPDQSYALQFSENLSNWISITTNTASGLGRTDFIATTEAGPKQGFYRAVEAP